MISRFNSELFKSLTIKEKCKWIILSLFLIQNSFPQENYTWEKVQNAGLDSNQTKFAIFSTTSSIFVGAVGGLYKSTDGLKWEKVYDGIAVGDFFQVDGIIYAAETNAVIRSTDEGNNWRKSYVPQYQYNGLWSVGSNGSRVFVSAVHRETEPLPPYYNDNVGNEGVWLPLDSARFAYLNVHNYSFQDNSIYMSTSKGIWYSHDIGKTWFQALSSEVIIDIISHNNILFAVGYGPSNELERQAKVYISDDKGLNWQQSYEGISASLCASLTILNEFIYVGCNEKLYYSSIFAGSNITWTNPSSSNLDTLIRSLAVFNDQIYAVTPRYGVWRLTNNSTSIKKLPNEIPSLFGMSSRINIFSMEGRLIHSFQKILGTEKIPQTFFPKKIPRPFIMKIENIKNGLGNPKIQAYVCNSLSECFFNWP